MASFGSVGAPCSWVLLRWYELFGWLGMDPNSGLTWGLSIVFLVVTIRLLLFRFFIKQVHSQRKMQEVQPKIAALREKYKNDRQTLSQEMMKLQKEEGFNPIGDGFSRDASNEWQQLDEEVVIPDTVTTIYFGQIPATAGILMTGDYSLTLKE